jgi:CSLREA domain-containing protein
MMRLTHDRVKTSRLLALVTLLVALMGSLVLAEGQVRASTTFTVNSTADHADALLTGDLCDTGYTVPGSGGEQEKECTLRAAINQANYTSGADTINFAIPGGGVKTINIGSTDLGALPPINEAVTINGYSQPGTSPNTKAVGTDAVLKIELSGARYPAGDGLVIGASNSTVKGLVINRWNDGLRIEGAQAKGNKVTGNYIGTDASGTQSLGNFAGVRVSSGSGNTIGGTTAAERNVISGNLYGVGVENTDATGNKVVGNYVGPDATGTKDLGGKAGVGIYFAPNNTVGGTTAGARNVISGNDESGVVIYGDNATGNRILSNSIFNNGSPGIDLGEYGPTANDPGDTDTGANALQNKPVITSAKTGDGSTTVRGKLNSAPNRTFKVQFFSNPSGTDEGKVFIGQKSVTTDGSGNVSFAFSPAQKVGLGRTITATATSPAGNTSEFSAPRTVVAR